MYGASRAVQVQGISDTTERTLGSMYSRGCEAERDFLVIGERTVILHDGVLGQDFWETMVAKIDHECKEIRMRSVRMKLYVDD
jgi:hypothetical protein